MAGSEWLPRELAGADDAPASAAPAADWLPRGDDAVTPAPPRRHRRLRPVHLVVPALVIVAAAAALATGVVGGTP